MSEAPAGFPPPPGPSEEVIASETDPSQEAVDDLPGDGVRADSEPPDGEDGEGSEPGPVRWKKPLVLFLLTAVSVHFAGYGYGRTYENACRFAWPLLTILLFHEFGHYIAARIHRVPASLPFFIPFPYLSPFGTMGAVIAMSGRIRSRNALLDIGASGPLAGMLIALPVLAWGISESEVGPLPLYGYAMEGQSLLYSLMKGIFNDVGPDQDLSMSPTAFAGWAGLFVTMLNLIPVGQLDGGHVAYALFGPRQNQYALWIRRSLLLLFAGNLVWFVGQSLSGNPRIPLWLAGVNSMSWLIWYGMLGVLNRFSGGKGHPPTEPGELSPIRKVVAAFTLALFVLLFMPTPWSSYYPDPSWTPIVPAAE